MESKHTYLWCRETCILYSCSTRSVVPEANASASGLPSTSSDARRITASVRDSLNGCRFTASARSCVMSRIGAADAPSLAGADAAEATLAVDEVVGLLCRPVRPCSVALTPMPAPVGDAPSVPARWRVGCPFCVAGTVAEALRADRCTTPPDAPLEPCLIRARCCFCFCSARCCSFTRACSCAPKASRKRSAAVMTAAMSVLAAAGGEATT